MMSSLKDIDWKDIATALPAYVTMIMMPFAYSISDGIGFGFITYSILKLCRGKAKEVPILVYIISVLFIVLYVLTYL